MRPRCRNVVLVATALAAAAALGGCGDDDGAPTDVPEAGDDGARDDAGWGDDCCGPYPDARDDGDVDDADVETGDDGRAPPPRLLSVLPDRGSTSGGTLVTLTGEGFAGGATATFGGVECADPAVTADTRMVCRTPPRAAGAVTVVVTNPDGQSHAVDGAFTYVESTGPVVGWCGLQHPERIDVPIEEEAGPIYGRAYVEGITPGAGRGAGVTAQIGFGPAGSAPTGWTWADATYNTDVDGLVPGDLANDEYAASVVPPAAGAFGYAYRFSADSGATWLYCDLNGSDDGFSPADAGTLVVTPRPGPLVDWCNLQWPENLAGTAGAPAGPIYGRVYVGGVTPGAGRGAGITGQVGFGAESADPSTWTWVDADYNVDVDGLVPGDLSNDEYWQSVVPVASGTYRYAFRFSRDGGVSWRLCDIDPGSADGFSIDRTGTLTVP